jgi:flavodoxin
MTIVELLDFKLTLASIFGSLDRDFYDFLKKLGSVICKVQSKGKQLILRGDWNINFLEDNAKLQELQNLFFMYNLINTVKSPSRVTI